MQGLVLGELLGEGGTARVHAARWHGTDVCAKVSHASTDAAASVLAEAATLARLGHPALPRMLAAGRLDDGRAYLVMPRLHGEDLAARRRRGGIALDEIIAIAQDVGGALTAMHEHDLLHRDIKPENIFLATSGPMLIDLGLARDLESSTVSAQPRGTHDHVAPERLFGEPATVASEVYELATVVWMMIAGRLPWPPGAGPAARRDVPPLAVDGPAQVLDGVLRRALSTRPDRRHATVAELIDELRAAATARAIAADRHTEPLAPRAAGEVAVVPAIGSVLAETYRLTRLIGKGSSGNVFEAAHLRLPLAFAIKVLRADCEDGEQRARFRREAEIIAAIDHPRIVKVFDYDVDTGRVPYMVMGLVTGETLRERLRRGPLQPADAITLVEQIADAIEVAHRAGVVHRDLKPSNVLLREAGGAVDAVVLDFGISKLIGGDLDVTTTGTQLGTPGYAPPEQVTGHEVGPAADVFALAAIAYEALTGERAFAAPTRDAVLYQICHGEPELAGVPRDVARVIRIGLSKHAARRWGSARELAAELRAAVERGSPSRRTFARTAAGTAVIASVAAAAIMLAPARHTAPAREVASPAPATHVTAAPPAAAPQVSPAAPAPQPVTRPRAPAPAVRDRARRPATTRAAPASLRTLLEQ